MSCLYATGSALSIDKINKIATVSGQMRKEYNQIPLKVIDSGKRTISLFSTDVDGANIDKGVVQSFGEEWSKFNEFSEADLKKLEAEYFDIITPEIVNKGTYGIDIGCGTGRWTKCLLDRIGFMEAIDPSDAIFSADKLLREKENVRLSVASTDNIPFDDDTFDFAMSIGVLHHIPDTRKAMKDCIKKVKPGGFFYTYLYYSLDNKGFIFRFILKVVTVIRKIVSRLPAWLKRIVCDLLAIFIYMPIILAGRLMNFFGLKKAAKKIPLSSYQDKSFFIIRNDSLDRFGTSLEQRFSKAEIIEMMTQCGLGNIVVSEKEPYWHAVGKKMSS